MILQSQVSYEQTDNGYKVIFKDITDENIKELTDNKNKIFRKSEDRNKLLQAIFKDNFKPCQNNSPANKDEKFEIPYLCLDFGIGAKIARREDFVPAEDWTMTETADYTLPLSKVDSDIKFYELNLNGNKLTEKLLLNDNQNLFSGKTNWTESELICWLLEKIANSFVTPEDFVEFSRRVINQLINEKKFTLEELVRLRFSIKKLLEEKIEILIDRAYQESWKTILFADETPKVCVTKEIAFSFDAMHYPAKKFHIGSEHFNKHFYAEIGYMNEEEIICAQFIDANPKVETWIRNIEREPNYSFWLPTHKDKFYPNFVVKLKDGTFAAIEYKGEVYKTNDDSKEKNMLGKIWANKSHGLCKFLMAVKRDDLGRNLSTQINEFLLD